MSENVDRFAGREAGDLIGRPLADIFERAAIHELRNRLVQIYDTDATERLFGLALIKEDREQRFDCAIHESGDLIVIEAEPSGPLASTEAAGVIRSMVGRLDKASDIGRFLHQGSRQIHGLTGFDRVMVYRFQSDGCGEVVAEVARSGLEPLLGLHYPASDIPQQARALYLRTPFRIICDVDAEPARIVPPLERADEPLDLSLSILRAVSPIHIAYLRNMGVVASLSISIIVDGRLWGLFACHHYTPRCPSFDLRTLAELFGQLFSMRLENRERRAEAETLAETRRIAERLMADMATDGTLIRDPAWLMRLVQDVLPCDGAAIAIRGKASATGIAPPTDILPLIAQRLCKISPANIFATDYLKGITPEACDGAVAPAGMLALPISTASEDWVMLFRREFVHSVTWAGNPQKLMASDTASLDLSPRTSFAAWKEDVRDRSAPFSEVEQSTADIIRVAIVDAILRLANAAFVEHERASQRQEVLIAELNHRVRNILTLIHSLIRKSSSSQISVEDYKVLLEGRILSLACAHDQITRDNWGPAPIRQIFEAAAEHYVGAKRITLADLPVMLEPLAFSTLSLVVHELTTNSTKYGALSGDGGIDIDWAIDAQGDLAITWHEHGGPVVIKPHSHGLGTTIIEQSISHDLGGSAAVTYDPAGVIAEFIIPARCVRIADAPIAGTPHLPLNAAYDRTVDMPSIDGSILLVEDSFLIAIHVEDMLIQLGVDRIATAATVEAALTEIETMRPAAAVLDINLGDETSLPVADSLRAAGIPYIFATGYGDQLALPPEHSNIPVLQKPYTKANIAAALSGLASFIANAAAGH